MPLGNLDSDRLNRETVKDKVIDALDETKTDVRDNYIETIKGLNKKDMANILKTNYSDGEKPDGTPKWKSWAEIRPGNNDYQYTVLVQTAMGLQYPDANIKIDSWYGSETSGLVERFIKEKGLDLGGGKYQWAGPQVFEALYESLNGSGDTEDSETPSTGVVDSPAEDSPEEESSGSSGEESSENENPEKNAEKEKDTEENTESTETFEGSLTVENVMDNEVNKLINYRSSEKISLGNRQVGLGEALRLTYSGSDRFSESRVTNKLEKIFNADTKNDPFIYAYALFKAMDGWGTHDKVVDLAINTADEKGILDKVYANFGSPGDANLVERVLYDLSGPGSRQSAFSFLRKISDYPGAPKKGVKQALLDQYGDNSVTQYLRDDTEFKKKLGVEWKGDRWHESNDSQTA